MMALACQQATWKAMSRGRPPSGAISAGIERVAGLTNARPIPKTITMTKIGSVAVGFVAM
ncbi:unannotated protein [freshwater metagenome]|uniref:Unannotated protein n=1 Tax=freshwater metagenome TaxID=449393 RepID=A0A6J6I3S6_9ZZZZ